MISSQAGMVAEKDAEMVPRPAIRAGEATFQPVPLPRNSLGRLRTAIKGDQAVHPKQKLLSRMRCLAEATTSLVAAKVVRGPSVAGLLAGRVRQSSSVGA